MEENLDVRYLSTGLYKIVQRKIGFEETIEARRFVVKLKSAFQEIENGSCGKDLLASGSTAEGFSFSTSDEDYMLVYKNIMVGIGSMGNRTNLPIQNREHFRMETEQTRPGFCLLRSLSQPNAADIEQDITQMLVRFQNAIYLSSILWRDQIAHILPQSLPHGPCESVIFGGVETDFAHCLKLPTWPLSAYPCLQNLVRVEWPSIQIISNIVRNGCHIVPIGDKSSDKELIEWRVSFSEAEKTLIQEMNHCQFLTYGLLKMFLKEVINTRQDVDGLLCSYFLKTVVFWEIVTNGKEWMEHEFLKWFWICFRRLLSWIASGYCPNFFIPENNMFFGKIQGRSQQVLIRHLTFLYRLGYKCLLGCSFNREFRVLLRHPVSFQLIQLSIKELKDIMLTDRLLSDVKCSNRLHVIHKSISYLFHVRMQSQTFTKTVIINTYLQYCLQRLLYGAAQKSLPSSISCNRILYKSVSQFINSLKRIRFDVSSHSILSAMILHRQKMYRHAIRTVSKIIIHMKSPYVIYERNGIDASKYHELGGNFTPVDVMIKSFFVNNVRFGNDIGIPELYLEHSCTDQQITYSPLVLLNFMLFLSYHHLFMHNEANATLDELTVLINNDYIHRARRNISWEILGISQEMMGRFEEAYVSYQNALKEPYFSFFRKATLLRIQNLCLKMNS